MTILIITIAVMALIIFAVYGKPSSKPSNQLKFEDIKIDKEKQCVMIGASFYKFSDIEKVYVWQRGRQANILNSVERPSLFNLFTPEERRFYYLAEISFYLKNGECIKKELHTKGDVYELLLHLNPYVELDDSPETFKPTFMDSPLAILVRYLLWGWY
ncbi:MAG TPA: hypothetical protein DCS44_04370 [Cyanobacteria bacterium UBA10660]|nr:MAG TPA: hypothetical protein CPT83_06360 [Candidatus Gastranaerophilales bacterium HUM_1]HAS93835.1 hypothetical protein [Cyanobacteria bacterium UBA10660]